MGIITRSGEFLFPKLRRSVAELHANHRVIWKCLTATALILEIENGALAT